MKSDWTKSLARLKPTNQIFLMPVGLMLVCRALLEAHRCPPAAGQEERKPSSATLCSSFTEKAFSSAESAANATSILQPPPVSSHQILVHRSVVQEYPVLVKKITQLRAFLDGSARIQAYNTCKV